MLGMRAGKLSGGMKNASVLPVLCREMRLSLLWMSLEQRWIWSVKESIRQYLKGYVNEGKTVILTSHEMEELSLCDRLYVMKDRCLKEIEAGLSSRN